MINFVIRIQRPIIIGLLPFFCCFLLDLPAVAQEKIKDEQRISNIRWTTKDEVIVINYDLKGSPDDKYVVDIKMKKDNDASFAIVPITISGDVGEGPYAGTNREIQWYYRRDYPQGFQGEGYYFEIHVRTISHQDMMLYYILGGAALAGGIIAIAVTRGQNTTPPTLELPTPPARP
jgi:hypothetical protein